MANNSFEKRLNRIKELSKGSPGLGIRSNVNFEEKTYELQKDDLIVLYSDGLTDARNEEGVFFGEQELFKTILNLKEHSSNLIGEQIIRKIDRFVGEAKVMDDLSLVIMRRVE